jgi:hypothetical protein
MFFTKKIIYEGVKKFQITFPKVNKVNITILEELAFIVGG